jgi:hypothetical protein
MTIRSLFARFALVAGLMWSCSSGPAADVTPPAPPAAVAAAPAVVGDGGCAACQSGGRGVAKSGCATCGKLPIGNLFKRTPNPYPVSLCPGACFGYFQTQWRKWDEVCPYPYLGMGVSDAGRIPGGGTGPKAGGGELAPPRPVETTNPKTTDPKTKAPSDLPPLPGVNPGNKFAP